MKWACSLEEPLEAFLLEVGVAGEDVSDTEVAAYDHRRAVDQAVALVRSAAVQVERSIE